jgi:hypothetical protein
MVTFSALLAEAFNPLDKFIGRRYRDVDDDFNFTVTSVDEADGVVRWRDDGGKAGLFDLASFLRAYNSHRFIQLLAPQSTGLEAQLDAAGAPYLKKLAAKFPQADAHALLEFDVAPERSRYALRDWIDALPSRKTPDGFDLDAIEPVRPGQKLAVHIGVRVIYAGEAPRKVNGTDRDPVLYWLEVRSGSIVVIMANSTVAYTCLEHA